MHVGKDLENCNVFKVFYAQGARKEISSFAARAPRGE